MNKTDTVINGVVFGAVLPISLFLSGWWGGFAINPQMRVFLPAIIGLVVGILADIIVMKRWLANVLNTDVRLLILIYFFYSFCVLGFFMGVPIFNPILGIIAGFFIGRKLYYEKAEPQKIYRTINSVSVFTVFVIIIISLTSAYIAMKDPTDTARNIQGMLSITSFTITTPMLIGLIISGGAGLAFIQYWLTKISAIVAYKR